MITHVFYKKSSAAFLRLCGRQVVMSLTVQTRTCASLYILTVVTRYTFLFVLIERKVFCINISFRFILIIYLRVKLITSYRFLLKPFYTQPRKVKEMNVLHKAVGQYPRAFVIRQFLTEASAIKAINHTPLCLAGVRGTHTDRNIPENSCSM